MRIGHRPLFFAAVAIACGVLLPFTPSEFRWLNVVLAGLAWFWVIALALEDLSRVRHHERPGAPP